MIYVKDQLERRIELRRVPQRIISLVPSQTELLYDLGLGDRVVGVTKFCVHPEIWFRSKTRIGGTKQIKMEVIKSLRPDLIIANKEENERNQVELLMEQYPLWCSDIKDLEGALEMIQQVGTLTNSLSKSKAIIDEIEEGFRSIEPLKLKKKTCAYLIWRKPYMCAGGDTYINNMLAYAGFENAFAEKLRYPVIRLEDLASAKLDYVLLSSEPYPFAEKHIKEVQGACPESKIILVDGEMFSWYGSRLLKVPAYFQSLDKWE